MPELPEVETVRAGIAPVLEGARLVSVEVARHDLRQPVPADFAARLTGRRVTAVLRRAKYLLIETDGGPAVLLHLGMSGSVRVFDNVRVEPRKHDHIDFVTDRGAHVIFNDPRRFGLALLIEGGAEATHPLLAGLGPEPLSNQFDALSLKESLAARSMAIKPALLDQTVVAGLGNIYVSESLFRARIHPEERAMDVPLRKLERLVPVIRDVLQEAIQSGGSSLNDHLQVNGELGYFQHRFRVYDRAGEPCSADGCRGTIHQLVQAGRSTYYCPRCQTKERRRGL